MCPGNSSWLSRAPPVMPGISLLSMIVWPFWTTVIHRPISVISKLCHSPGLRGSLWGITGRSDGISIPVVRAQNTLVGAQLRNQSCDGIDALGFGELDNFPEGGLEPLLRRHGAQNRLHSAVCQGGNLPQAQQSTVGGHER